MDNKEYKKWLLDRVLKYGKDSIKFVDSLPNKRSCYIIGDQYLRSGTSVGANIVEAQASSSKKDFINFLTHSLKSANESKYWLFLLKGIEGINESELNRLLKEVDEIARMLGSTLSKLKGKREL